MLVHAHGFAVSRGTAEHVHVELDVRGGLPAFSVIGLGAGAARDARERVQAAVLNSGYAVPRKRVTANLARAATARGAPAFDLVLACCVLAAQGEIDASRLVRIGLFAELGLGGDLRPCDGVGAVADVAGEAGLDGLIVARQNLREAHAVGAVGVAGLSSLRVVAELLKPRPGGKRRRCSDPTPDSVRPTARDARTSGAPRADARAGSTNNTTAGVQGARAP